MKQLLPILIGLFLSAPAWSNINQSMDEIDKLIRLRDYQQAVIRLETLADAGDPEASRYWASGSPASARVFAIRVPTC